jgi:hypothetical protein
MPTTMEVIQPPAVDAPPNESEAVPTAHRYVPEPIPPQGMPAVADNTSESTPAAHRFVPTPAEVTALPTRKIPTRIRKQNGQRIGSNRNSSTKASRRRIASLIKTQVALDRALLQHVDVNDEIKVKVQTIEPQFTYNFSSPKGKPAPMITQEDEPREETPLSTPKRRSRRINGSISPRPAGIACAALHQFMGNAFLEEMKKTIESNAHPLQPEEVANGVVHPVTKETITKYKKLIDDPLMRDVWSKAMCKELGRLTQGFGEIGSTDHTEGTNTMRFLDREGIGKIPRDRVVTYARIVVDYRAHKKDPNRVRITAGGNLLKNLYPGELTTRTSDLTTSKVMWNSVISTHGARFMAGDASNFYLATPLKRYQYMRIPIELIPQEFIDQYQLQDKVKNGFVYCEIIRGMYGLPEAGVLANKLLKERLLKFGYSEVDHTPGLFKHETRPVWFTLTVDDFGVKYVGRQHAEHLMWALKHHYKMEEDWEGKLYCGIKLDWNYAQGYVDISMPNYVQKKLTEYNHPAPTRAQHCPYQPNPIKYGKNSDEIIQETDSPLLDKEGKKYVQQVLGSFLYYARAIDMTILHALSAIASDQANPTQRTMQRVKQLLDYMHTNPNAIIRFRASDMILNVHSDASYMSAGRARSRAGGYFFLGSMPRDNEPIQLNGNIAITCAILKIVAASAAEAELGALFVNTKEARVIRLILAELGHPQPPTPMHIDNTTAVGIVNSTIKRQRSRSMEMRYFWLLDQETQRYFKFYYHPGAELMADYPTKAHVGPIHTHVRPYYLHMENSPTRLIRAAKPSARRGCAEILGDPYVRGIPLPRIPDYRAPAGAAAASAVQGTGSNCRPSGPRQTVILAAIRHYLSAISIVR